MNDKHILLVEDDETLQALIEKLLVNNDYVVSKAVNIEEAKKLVKLFLFDLIILDVMLPDSTGLDFYENTIKKMNIKYGYVRPVIWRGSEMMAISAQKNKINVAVATWEWPS